MVPDPEAPMPDEPEPQPQPQPQPEPAPQPAPPPTAPPVYGPATGGPPPDQAQPAPTGLSKGAGIGVGVGIGCGAHIIGFGLMFVAIGSATIFGWLWPYIVIAVTAIVLMFFQRTRSIATGMLIIVAAAWIIVLGPCIALLGGI
ncbi:hypothetical protein ACWGST_13905 [Agromyces sp. NPDC055520]